MSTISASSAAKEAAEISGAPCARAAATNDSAVMSCDGAAEEMDVEDPEETLYSAAYEHVTYRDTTDDGIEGELFDPSATHEELANVAEQLDDWLSFHDCLSDIWRIAALSESARLHRQLVEGDPAIDEVCQTLRGWVHQLRQARLVLEELLYFLGLLLSIEIYLDYNLMEDVYF